MELGEKLRQARLEAGLSQRQLCGEQITRNMLSQIENGTARPSMDTLGYLAGRLGKSISYFLEETAVTSPNQQVMASARKRLENKDFSGCLAALQGYKAPDPVFDWECRYMIALSSVDLAREQITQGRLPYAAQLLEDAAAAGEQTPYYTRELERSRLLLLAKTGQVPLAQVANQLPGEDEALLVRAEAALLRGDIARCGAYLAACEQQHQVHWRQLMAEALFAKKQYRRAMEYYEALPGSLQVFARLEICCRELGDFQKAYEYACRQRH